VGVVKLFGEFLVEKGLINKDLLADALVEQVRTMPSYVELAWKGKLLSADDLLNVLKLQTVKRIGFLEAMHELGLWNEALEQTLLKSGGSARTPLGEILVKRGVVSLEMIAHSLDEFLGEIKAAPAEAAAPVSVPAAASGHVSSAATAATSGSALVFFETFSPDLKGKLEELSERFNSGTNSGREQIKEVFDEVHRIRGASRLANAVKSEEYCAFFEGDLQLILGLQSPPDDLVKNLGRTTKALCEVLWGIREAMESGGDEGAFLGSPEAKPKVDSLMSYLEILKFNAEMAG
jgi:hypothetical protein